MVTGLLPCKVNCATLPHTIVDNAPMGMLDLLETRNFGHRGDAVLQTKEGLQPVQGLVILDEH